MAGAYVIGICGGSASGKTYLLHQISARFTEPSVCLLSQDHYYKKPEDQILDDLGYINFDVPAAINTDLFLENLQRILQGEGITKEEYLFNHPDLKPGELTFLPAPVIIIEGLFLFHEPKIASMLDYKVFLDANMQELYSRRLELDRVERSIPEDLVHYQWHKHVLPSYRRYILPYKNHADLIITPDTFESGLEVLLNIINMHLA